jgi:hypothetical protein
VYTRRSDDRLQLHEGGVHSVTVLTIKMGQGCSLVQEWLYPAKFDNVEQITVVHSHIL